MNINELSALVDGLDVVVSLSFVSFGSWELEK